MKTDAKVDNEPVVGETLMAVNVDVVATTGYRTSKLLKSDINNDKGEKIGKLDDFIFVSEDKVSVAIVAVGGFLGMGKWMVAVPAGFLESNAQGKVVLPGATKDRLKALAAFQYTTWVAFGKPSELIDGVTAPVNVHKLFLWLGAFAGTLLVGLSKAIKFAHVTFFSEGLIKNADGSVDLYFGRKAPKGKESNWIQINKGESVFVYLRLYGPEQAYFDHTFPMNKIKKLK